MKHIVLSVTLACAGSLSMLADFSYQQSTKMTGGSMMRLAGAFSKQAREPVVATVLVQRRRMAHIKQRTAEIIDIDKESMSHVDFDKKTWSVMTSAQMQQMMQHATSRMQGKNGNQPDVDFKADVKDTG